MWREWCVGHLACTVSSGEVYQCRLDALYADATIWGNPGNTVETNHPRSLCPLSHSNISDLELATLRGKVCHVTFRLSTFKLRVWLVTISDSGFFSHLFVHMCSLASHRFTHAKITQCVLTITPFWTHNHSIWTHQDSMLDSSPSG